MESKVHLRERILSLRNRLSAEEREAKSLLIARRLEELWEFRQAKTVLAYASFKSEVSTEIIIHKMLEQGKRVLLPVVEAKERRLLSIEIWDMEDLVPGYAGIPEPRQATRPVPGEEIELVLVPGVAFDLEGHRLGYGLGFYDRFLADLKASLPKIGLAYEVQILERLPSKGHDLPMTAIITEERIIRPRIKNRGL